MITDAEFNTVVRELFNDPKRRIVLRKSDFLLRSGDHNDKLYLVLTGRLKGLVSDANGHLLEIFQAGVNDLVGFHSFFSKTFISLTNVQAVEDTELAYIETSQLDDMRAKGTYLFEAFLPIIAREFVNRHRQMKDLVIEKEHTFQHLIETEKLASLGQMAAGIAHELNNAIAVLQRNSEWIANELVALITKSYPDALPFYGKGVQEGRTLSGAQVRKRRRDLEGKLQGLDRQMLDDWIEMDLEGLELKDIDLNSLSRLHAYWELGSAFHDMLLAAGQAAHVVKSVKTLGAKTGKVRQLRNINHSIEETITLLRSKLRTVNVRLDLSELPEIMVNRGEWVQVWTNLIQNACDSMVQNQVDQPQLVITSRSENDLIVVTVQDNGPGIPNQLLPDIFQPNVTTKVDGLSFGLGLGLTIVNRIVESYMGTIRVESKPGCTVFTVEIPLGESHGKTVPHLH